MKREQSGIQHLKSTSAMRKQHVARDHVSNGNAPAAHGTTHGRCQSQMTISVAPVPRRRHPHLATVALAAVDLDPHCHQPHCRLSARFLQEAPVATGRPAA